MALAGPVYLPFLFRMVKWQKRKSGQCPCNIATFSFLTVGWFIVGRFDGSENWGTLVALMRRLQAFDGVRG